jgi:hypothetical protein
MKTIYTAIFGNYEELKEPAVVTAGWKYICFTDQPFKSKTWDIMTIPQYGDDSTRSARYFKIMYHRHITAEKSIWVDGSFTISCDLDKFWNTHFVSPFSVPKHPVRDCVYEEFEACIKDKRGGLNDLLNQCERYRRVGLPEHNGLIQSGLLLRENSREVIKFCEYWWRELEQSSTRDQIAFAMIAWHNKVHHCFNWDYRQGQDFIYTKHFKYRK